MVFLGKADPASKRPPGKIVVYQESPAKLVVVPLWPPKNGGPACLSGKTDQWYIDIYVNTSKKDDSTYLRVKFKARATPAAGSQDPTGLPPAEAAAPAPDQPPPDDSDGTPIF